jgi:cell division protein FtsZ
VASIARKLGALTIGVVTRPFAFEGKRRAVQAESGIEELRNECDTLIVIPNDRLLQLGDRNVSVMDAFRTADQVLLSGVQGITDLITTPGLINLDFADVKSVMSGAGSALMGIGSARGDNRALLAAEQAIASPLLEASMEGAHGVLLSISGGSDLGLFEINEAASLVSDAAHADANIIFGAVIDDALGDEVRVTVIAAGFDSGRPSTRKDTSASATPGSTPSASAAGGLPPYRRPVTAPAVHQSAGERRVVPQTAVSQPASQANGGTPAQAPSRPAQAPTGGGITVPPLPPIPGPVSGRRPLSNEDFEEELDIPEFLKG